VVIPTRGRPELVARAARSALAQTTRDLEVVVVLDGPDPRSMAVLESIDDARVRVEALARAAGPGAARNAGVRAAAASWVAFLDDDDEWRPDKLARQLESATSSRYACPIVASRLLARDGNGRDRLWPRRLPRAGEPLSEYLLARRGFFWGEALVQTSTLLMRRELLERVPFREELLRHEDLDLLLRAIREPGAGLVFAAPQEPLAIWHTEPGRARASQSPGWEASLAWIRSVRTLVTPRAYAAFVLAWVAVEAARDRRRATLLRFVAEAFRGGRPAPVDLVVATGAWVLPAGARERASAALDSLLSSPVARDGSPG
jgi:hypothetical protein